MNKSISFCQTSRNRLWQLKETLSSNLRTIEEDCEIVLVDYGSTDGLARWVWQNYKPFIQNRTLTFFEVRNTVRWSSPCAKNLAHRLSAGGYLFNLDADNFISSNDIRMIRELATTDNPCHQFSGDFGDGSFGRIGLSRALFFELGGYDETMLPMGGQDIDLLRRLKALGRTPKNLPGPEKAAIINTFSQKMASVGRGQTNEELAQRNWRDMEEINQVISKIRLASEGPSRLHGFKTFQGLLNGEMVIINGFNRIQKNAF
jgi:hypothetical protein